MPDHPVRAKARPLTPEEAQERVATVQALHERITAAHRAGRRAWWLMAEALYEFDEMSGWSALTRSDGRTRYETRAEYLDAVGLAVSTYREMVDLWDQYAVRRRIAPSVLSEIDPSKARAVLAAINDGRVRPVAALEDAKALPLRALREQYRRPELQESPQPPTTPVGASQSPEPVVVESTAAAEERTASLELSEPVLEPTRRPAEPAHNAEPPGSGQVAVAPEPVEVAEVVSPSGLTARDVRERLAMAMSPGASPAIMLNAVRKADEYLAALVPTDGVG